MEPKIHALPAIADSLDQLSKKLSKTNDPATRGELLKRMRSLIGDVDKVIQNEMGED